MKKTVTQKQVSKSAAKLLRHTVVYNREATQINVLKYDCWSLCKLHHLILQSDQQLHFNIASKINLLQFKVLFTAI